MDNHESDRLWMTPLLNRIADAIGEAATLKLAQERASQQIYIPRKVSGDHWLVPIIGCEAATKLSGAFGGENMVLPPALAGDKRRRARTIAHLIDKGYSINEITRLTGVARSTVIEHRGKRPAKDDGQGSLF